MHSSSDLGGAPARRWLAAAVLLGVLAAGCGGGGSGGGGFSASPGSLAFQADWGSEPGASQVITMEVTNPSAAYLGYGWPDGDPGWLRLGAFSGTGTRYMVAASVVSASLPSGTHTTRLRVGIANSSGDVLATQDIPVSYTIRPGLRVAEWSAGWAWVEGTAWPEASPLHVDGSEPRWDAAVDQPWIRLAASSGSLPATLMVSADPTGLPRGTHQGTVTLSAGAAAPVSVPVTLEVRGPQLVTNTDTVYFNGVNGGLILEEQVGIHLTSGQAQAWTASTDAPWLVVDRAAGLTPDTILVHVDPSIGPLASGSHSAALTIRASVGAEELVATVNAHLVLRPASLTASPSVLPLGGASGRDLSGMPLVVSLDTGPLAHPFAVEVDAPWLVATPAAGQASWAPTELLLAPDRTGLIGGDYAGKATITAQVNGDVVSTQVQVLLSLDRHLLLASDQGVAFTSTPGLSTLTRTLQVVDNFGGATAWTASASQPWLTVTASGTTPGELVLTADPAGLPPDALQQAVVTLHAADASVERDETVAVGLWVGSATPGPIANVTPAAAWREVVADPVRPYVYAHAGGSDVTAFNVHTGAQVGVYPRVANALGELAVSGDGATLYAFDTVDRRVVPVDLASGAVGAGWAVGAFTAGQLAYGRTNGTGLVHAGGACAFEASTGRQVLSGDCYDIPAASRDGRRLCWMPTGYTPADVWCAPIDFTRRGGGTALLGPFAHATVNGSNFQLSVNADGTRAYVANGGPYRVFDAATLAGLQALEWAPIDVATDGRILAVRWDTQQLVVYDAGGAVLGTVSVGASGGELPFRHAVFSGDGLRAVGAFPASGQLGMATVRW